MTRSEFIKLCFLAVFSPYFKTKGVSVFSELLIKIAQGEKLSPTELEDFSREARLLEDTQHLVSQWGEVNRKVSDNAINFPFYPIYSKEVEAATPTITVEIPPQYKHLFFLGLGQAATSGTVKLNFNGDTGGGNTYRYTDIEANGLTVASFGDATYAFCPIGFFPSTGSGHIFGWVPHYNSAFYKSCISFSANATSGSYGGLTFYTFSRWENTAKITKAVLSIYGDYNFSVGSLISIYGIL